MAAHYRARKGAGEKVPGLFFAKKNKPGTFFP